MLMGFTVGTPCIIAQRSFRRVSALLSFIVGHLPTNGDPKPLWPRREQHRRLTVSWRRPLQYAISSAVAVPRSLRFRAGALPRRDEEELWEDEDDVVVPEQRGETSKESGGFLATFEMCFVHGRSLRAIR
jgi:hypothetical protein